MRRSVYRRPDKPMAVKRRHRTDPDELSTRPAVEPVIVGRHSECHVTPPAVAMRMCAYLDPRPNLPTLEPSAGTGALVSALIDHGVSPRSITAVEREHKLATRLESVGVVHDCFLDYAATYQAQPFERVIMNPPFSKAKHHVVAARSLLSKDGILVAIVPSTFDIDGMEVLEDLGPDTFTTAKVYTKIIRLING